MILPRTRPGWRGKSSETAAMISAMHSATSSTPSIRRGTRLWRSARQGCASRFRARRWRCATSSASGPRSGCPRPAGYASEGLGRLVERCGMQRSRTRPARAGRSPSGSLGEIHLLVPGAGTSQRRPRCGVQDPKSRPGCGRVFTCTACEHQDHAGHNASVNVEWLAAERFGQPGSSIAAGPAVDSTGWRKPSRSLKASGGSVKRAGAVPRGSNAESGLA